MIETDFYEALGVTPASEQAVIDAAYRALMLKYHPDKNAGGPSDLRRAREINQAYETLRDPRRRAEYNLQRSGTTNVPATYRPRDEEPEGSPPPQSASKNCIECDEPIRLNARVCRYCGAQQFGTSASQKHATNVHTHIYPSAPPSPIVEAPKPGASCASIIGWVTLAALLVALLLGMVGFLTGAVKKDSGENVTQVNELKNVESSQVLNDSIEQQAVSADGEAPGTEAPLNDRLRNMTPEQRSAALSAGVVAANRGSMEDRESVQPPRGDVGPLNEPSAQAEADPFAN